MKTRFNTINRIGLLASVVFSLGIGAAAASDVRPQVDARLCQPLDQNNLNLCCMAENRDEILTPLQAESCPGVTTSRVGLALDQLEAIGGNLVRGDDAAGPYDDIETGAIPAPGAINPSEDDSLVPPGDDDGRLGGVPNGDGDVIGGDGDDLAGDGDVIGDGDDLAGDGDDLAGDGDDLAGDGDVIGGGDGDGGDVDGDVAGDGDVIGGDGDDRDRGGDTDVGGDVGGDVDGEVEVGGGPEDGRSDGDAGAGGNGSAGRSGGGPQGNNGFGNGGRDGVPGGSDHQDRTR